MPVDSELDSLQKTEISVQQDVDQHAKSPEEGVKSLYNRLRAKGMVNSEVATYVMGLLDSNANGLDYDTLKGVAALAAQNNDNAEVPLTSPTQDEIDRGIEELERYANEGHTGHESADELDDPLPAPVSDEPEVAPLDDDITRRTANPSGVSSEQVDPAVEPEATLDDSPPNDTTDVDGSGGGGDDNGGHDDVSQDTTFSLTYGRAGRERDRQNYRAQYAEAKLADHLEEGGFIKKTLRRMFKGNLLRDTYLQRYQLEYDKFVDENGGYLEVPLELLRGTSLEEAIRLSQRASVAATDWAISQDPQMQTMLREGETAAEISGDPEVDAQLRVAIKDLALRYARGELDNDSLIDERNRLFGQINGLNQELFGKGVGFSDNILEIARSVRAEIEHQDGLARAERALDSLDLRGALARGAAETETRRTVMDKIALKIGDTRIGGSAIASAIIIAGAVVYSGTQRGAVSGLSTALRLTGIGAAGAGTIASMLEARRVRQEAGLVRQEAAYSVDRESDQNPRRRAMETAVVYASEDVPAATENLKLMLDENGNLLTLDTEHPELEAQAQVTKMRTLLEQSDTKKIDLLRFSSIAAAVDERVELLHSIIAVEAALQKLQTVEEGDSEDIIAQKQHLSVMLDQQRAATVTSETVDVQENVTAHDKAYKVLMAKRMGVAFAAGTVAGFTAGLVIQEGVAAINPHVDGIFETQSPGTPNTLLNSILFGQHNSAPGAQVATEQMNTGGSSHEVPIGSTKSVLHLPQEYELQPSGDKTYDIVNTNNGQTVVDNITVGKYGGLTAESKGLLSAHNINVYQTSELISGEPKTVTSGEFYHANKEHLIHSSNRLMMNDTVNNPDYNELHFYAAGKEGWFTRNGNVHIRVDGITPNGSFQGNYHPNPVEAVQQGKLKVFMSIDKAHGLDNFAFKVVERNGHYEVLIPKTSPAVQLFGERHGDGGANEGFLGRYLGTAIDNGPNKAGVHQFDVINSVVGDTPKHQFEIPGVEKAYDIRLAFSEVTVPVVEAPSNETIPAFGPPIYPRRGVGAPRREQKPSPEPSPYYDGYYGSAEQQAEWELDRSPRLRGNPDAQLNPREELVWYRDRLRERNGDDYVDSLEQQIEAIPELKELPKMTKAVVCIPVAAANESENIYTTLSLYAQQENVNPGEVTILLHVNWMDEAMNDPTKRAAIEKTRAEIARAKADFPDIRIAVLETEWEKAFMDTQRGVIGHVARKMMDVAALASAHAQDIGQFEPDQDVLVIRNDSDAKGMSRKYLSHMIRSSEIDTSSDAFVGGMRWETTSHRDFPGFGVSGNFREVMQALTGRPDSRDRVPTIGINHAIRVSMLAAIGGLGNGDYTGAGSDDLEIQARVYAARDTSRAQPGPVGYNGYSGGTGSTTPSVRRPIKYVVGAQIDSSADRVMAAYFGDGRGFVDAWRDFDAGGYKEPDMANIPSSPEDPIADIDAVAGRIERDISNMSTQWFRDPARVRTGLAFMFPDSTKGGRPVYRISWRSGVCTFAFTDEGKMWLKNRLTRDSKGRYDPFGSRAARALYGRVSDGAAKQPKAPLSPMIGPEA